MKNSNDTIRKQDYIHTYTEEPCHRLNSKLMPYCAATIIE